MARARSGVDLSTLQRYGAAVLFAVCTLPVVALLLYALFDFPSEGLLRGGLRLLAEPQAPTLYGAYVVTTLSTLVGSVLLPSLKMEEAGHVRILPAGLGVLGYTGVIAAAGLVFLLIVAGRDNYNVLLAEMPGDGGAAQIKAYASWAVGACLTVFAALFGVPPPKGASTGPVVEQTQTP